MQTTFIGTTKNHLRVSADLKSSHAATHLADTPHLLELVREALSLISPEDADVYTEVDLGRIIGTSDLVITTDTDDIFYAKRRNRTNYTRFVRNRRPIETSIVTLVLHRQASDYLLYSAWIGWAAPPFPDDEKDTPESYTFWKTHALAWGQQEVQPNTEVADWPWG